MLLGHLTGRADPFLGFPEQMKFQLGHKGQGEFSQKKMGMESHPTFPFIKKEGKQEGNKITYSLGIFYSLCKLHEIIFTKRGGKWYLSEYLHSTQL